MTIRTGDTVKHLPSNETWLVAFVDGNDLAWCGWPEGYARTSDCILLKSCSDEEHLKLLRDLAAMSGRDMRKTHAIAALEKLEGSAA